MKDISIKVVRLLSKSIGIWYTKYAESTHSLVAEKECCYIYM